MTPKASSRQVAKLHKKMPGNKSGLEDYENFNGFDKESPKVIKSPYSGGNRKRSNPSTSNTIVADEEQIL